MKLKLATYCIIAMIGLSTSFYAAPDYSRLLRQPAPQREKQAITVKKTDIKIAQKNYSHQSKSRVQNSTRPVQRCIKALKI
jgi:hypothetical protein